MGSGEGVNMGILVCAIRGGEASRRTQGKAINLAKERGHNITFLYVADQNLIEKSDLRIKNELKEEINFIGRLLLRVARSEAKQKGVEADFVIGEGTIREAIENCIREKKADLLVLGSPKEEHNQKYFKTEQIEKFAELITESTGVKVEIV
jgi:nucleotide-binding universal stress UspA family protein